MADQIISEIIEDVVCKNNMLLSDKKGQTTQRSMKQYLVKIHQPQPTTQPIMVGGCKAKIVKSTLSPVQNKTTKTKTVTKPKNTTTIVSSKPPKIGTTTTIKTISASNIQSVYQPTINTHPPPTLPPPKYSYENQQESSRNQAFLPPKDKLDHPPPVVKPEHPPPIQSDHLQSTPIEQKRMKLNNNILEKFNQMLGGPTHQAKHPTTLVHTHPLPKPVPKFQTKNTQKPPLNQTNRSVKKPKKEDDLKKIMGNKKLGAAMQMWLIKDKEAKELEKSDALIKEERSKRRKGVHSVVHGDIHVQLHDVTDRGVHDTRDICLQKST